MAKDDFIGIRVTKEFKKFIQKEAKRKGLSLSEYIESHADDNFKLTKKHVETLMERAKEDFPTFWSEAEKSQITKNFEQFILMIVNDFINPINRRNPSLHPSFMTMYVPRLMGSIAYIDSIEDKHKRSVINNYLSAGKIIAENLNKLKVEDSADQRSIVTDIKNMIETFAFSFTSMAFEKESFLKIKQELDKVEKTLHKDIEGRDKK